MRYVQYFIFLLIPFVLGCTAATPNVSSLGGMLNPFYISQSEIRVDDLSDLSSITITAQCLLNQTSFEFEIPDISNPVSWTPLTITPPIVGITNSCNTTQTLAVTLDLDTYDDFPTIIGTMGAFRTIRFRDNNLTGFPFTDEVRVIYSPMVLSQERFIFGQGNNNPICQGPYCLRGRVVNQTLSETQVQGSFKLKGRVVYQ